MSRLSKEAVEALYAENGWNEHRLRRSFANKGFVVLNEECDVDAQGLFFEIGFEQIREREDGFAVSVHIRLAIDMRYWLAYLSVRGQGSPLHEPVQVPVKYGFSAQANQLLTATIGLQYVYNVAGVQALEFFPEGLQGFAHC